jgi:membrane-anchored glycerophosphoryl diester phosphodiesterase (GDPDase)
VVINIIFFFGSMAAATVWSIRIFCRNSLAVPACLLERLPARQALKRSRWLTKKSLGRHFLVFLLTGLLAGALFYAFLVPGMFAAGKIPTAIIIGWQALAAFAALALSFPIGTIATSLLYYDQRVRKEAFDLQLMMETMTQPTPQPTSAGSVAGL